MKSSRTVRGSAELFTALFAKRKFSVNSSDFCSNFLGQTAAASGPESCYSDTKKFFILVA